MGIEDDAKQLAARAHISIDRKHLVAYAVLFAVVSFLFVIWREGRADADGLKVKLETQQKFIEEVRIERKQHEDEDKARAEETAKQLDAMRRIVAEVKTPQQITGWSQSQLEGAIRGIKITVPAPTAENPHPEATVSIPEVSLPQLRDTIAKCQEDKVMLGSCQKDVVSRQEQMVLADRQIEAIKKQRDDAITAAKGGSFWKRTKRAAKWLAIGAAVGYVVAKTR